MRKCIIAAASLFLFGCTPPSNSTVDIIDAGAAADVSFDTSDDTQTQYDSGPEQTDGNFPSGSFDLGNPETDPIMYLGGPVVTAPLNVYVIWYGNWSDEKTIPVIDGFISNLGNSSWFKINTLYYQQSGVASYDAGIIPALRKFKTHGTGYGIHTNGAVQDGGENDSGSEAGTPDAGPGPKSYVNGAINFVRSVTVGYVYGKDLFDSDVANIVSYTITNNGLPTDPNGAYVVFTAPDVTERSNDGSIQFCVDYCGWHNTQVISNTNIQYVFIGDPTPCIDLCTVSSEYDTLNLPAPNGDWPADGMVSVIGHELSELVTDPTLASWQDDFGYEIGDKCAWTFGQPYLTKTGSVANVSIGGRDYMIQQNWIFSGGGVGYCGLSL